MREKKLVDNFMMNYDVDYKITDFSDYTEEFFQAMYDETCFKIYLFRLFKLILIPDLMSQEELERNKMIGFLLL